jgi:hypothetical protein
MRSIMAFVICSACSGPAIDVSGTFATAVPERFVAVSGYLYGEIVGESAMYTGLRFMNQPDACNEPVAGNATTSQRSVLEVDLLVGAPTSPDDPSGAIPDHMVHGPGTFAVGPTPSVPGANGAWYFEGASGNATGMFTDGTVDVTDVYGESLVGTLHVQDASGATVDGSFTVSACPPPQVLPE